MNSTSSPLNTLLIWVIVITALFVGREVIIPIALACILSFMLAPPVRALQNFRVPRGMAVVFVVLLAFGAISALGGLMAREATQLAGDLPPIRRRSAPRSNPARRAIRGTLEQAQRVLENLEEELNPRHSRRLRPRRRPNCAGTGAPIAVEVHEPSGGPLQTLSSLITPLLGPLATTGIIVIFVMFILIQREDLRNRLIRLAGSTDIPHTTAAIDDAAHRLSHLFLTQLAINTGFGVLIGLGLWLIGIPSPFLWGMLAGILRFVPYIGPVLGMIFPLVLAVSVDPGWSMTIWTGVLFVGLEA